MMSKISRKQIYRALEFFQKTCMYPLIFFAMFTIERGPMVIIDSYSFHQTSQALCLALIVCYITMIVWQWFFETVAKVNRIENVCDFLSIVLSSLVISLSVYKKWYLMLVVVFALRGGSYFWSRKKLLRDFFNIEYMKIVTTVLECITFATLLSGSMITMAILSFVTVLLQLSHEVAILVMTDRLANSHKVQYE
jgi:hypothetical protein